MEKDPLSIFIFFKCYAKKLHSLFPESFPFCRTYTTSPNSHPVKERFTFIKGKSSLLCHYIKCILVQWVASQKLHKIYTNINFKSQRLGSRACIDTCSFRILYWGEIHITEGTTLKGSLRTHSVVQPPLLPKQVPAAFFWGKDLWFDFSPLFFLTLVKYT